MFANHKIPKHLITEHLQKIYQGFLHASAAQDEEFLSEYLEKNFYK
jgi:hypothetical protein